MKRAHSSSTSQSLLALALAVGAFTACIILWADTQSIQSGDTLAASNPLYIDGLGDAR